MAHEPPAAKRVFPRGRPYPPREPRRTRELPRFVARESIFEEREELVQGFA